MYYLFLNIPSPRFCKARSSVHEVPCLCLCLCLTLHIEHYPYIRHPSPQPDFPYSMENQQQRPSKTINKPSQPAHSQTTNRKTSPAIHPHLRRSIHSAIPGPSGSGGGGADLTCW